MTVPISTSSSERCAALTRWRATWITALAIAAVALGALEWHYRQAGYLTNIEDGEGVWSIERARVYENNPKTLVVLGASRIHSAFDPETFRKESNGYKIIQLAVSGLEPVATLLELAEDEFFTGVALISLTAKMMERENWGAQRPFIDHYKRKYNLSEYIHLAVRKAVQSLFVAANPQLSFDQVVKRALTGKTPIPPAYITLDSERKRITDFSRASEGFRQKLIDSVIKSYSTLATPPTPEKWYRELEPIFAAVKKLEERGGKVVFIRMPTTEESYEIDETRNPKEKYWNRFADSGVVRTIYFSDYESLASFECPDTSHIDSKDAPKFTHHLTQIMIEEGILN